MIGIPEVVESTKETRKKLEKMSDKELIEKMIDVDQSIKAGFPHNIYYQEYSVGMDILRKRGLEINTRKELYKIRGE